MSKSLFVRFLYAVRDLRSRRMFGALREYCRGDVLDIGGWDFFLTARKHVRGLKTWTSLENSAERATPIQDPQYRLVIGDGCHMPEQPGNSYDTVLNIQVLEHVFEPNAMVREMARVLKPGGYCIILAPQTSTLHLAPHHYYNFTQFWLRRALDAAGLEIVCLEPLGGFWSSMASRSFQFFPMAFRHSGMTVPERRGAWFYVLFPFMAVAACLGILTGLILSLGDLPEEPNNHLVVARKRPPQVPVA